MKFKIITWIFISILVSTIAVANNVIAEEPETSATKEWTLFVYIDADNNLEGQGVEDFLEMAQVGSDSNINIVVQMDRVGWYDLYYHFIDQGYSSSQASDMADAADDTRYGDWETTKRFYITKDMTPISSNAISDLGEKNMGAPQTLYDFVSWGLDNYPANRYGLILWDHGGQWSGVCSDDTDDGDLLNMSELDLTFSYLSYYDDFYMDFLGFDACLMGSMEVAYQAWYYTDYMIASEMIEPGYGWIYNWSFGALAKNPKMTTESFCKIIVDDYVKSYETLYKKDQNDVTLSVVNYTDFYTGIYAFYNYTYELYKNYSMYQNYLNYAFGIGEYYSDMYIDAMDFLYSTYYLTNHTNLNGLFDKMLNNISSVYCYQNFSDGDDDGCPYYATGLTLYAPPEDYYDSDYTADKFFYFPQDMYWPDLLQKVYNQPTNTDPKINSYTPTSKPQIYETEWIEFSVKASDAQGNYLRYYWYLDDEFVGEGNILNITTEYGDAGTYIIECYVLDGVMDGLNYGLTGYDLKEWTLTVKEDNTPPILSNPVIPKSLNYGSNNHLEIQVMDNFRLDKVHFLNDFITYDNGSFFNITLENTGIGMYGIDFHCPENGFPVQFTDPGWHNVTFQACDMAGNWATLSDVPWYLPDIHDPVIPNLSDIEIDQHETVVFDASGCSDNWGIINYTWSFTYNGLNILLFDEISSFLFDMAGTYSINLVITDREGNNASSTFNVTVNDIDIPVAIAGEDVTIDQHQSVILDGSLSSDNVGISDFIWSFDYDKIEIRLEDAATSFTFDIVGEYNITLTIIDTSGNVGSDYLTVTVLDVTDPVIDITSIIEVDQSEIFMLDGSDCHDNVMITNFTWTINLKGLETSLYGQFVEYSIDDAGEYTIILTVMDERGNTASKNIMLIVRDVTSPIPVITIPILDNIIYPGIISLSGSQSTDNVGIVSYQWTIIHNGEEFILSGEIVNFDFFEEGKYTISLVVADASGNSQEISKDIQITKKSIPDDDIIDDNDDNITDNDDPSHDDNQTIDDDNKTLDNDTNQTGENDDPIITEENENGLLPIYIIVTALIIIILLIVLITLTYILVKKSKKEDNNQHVDVESKKISHVDVLKKE